MGLTANLPSGWNLVSLYELAEKQKAKFDDGDWIEAEHITDRGVRLVQTGNIGIGRFVEKDIKKYIFQSSYEKLKCKQLHIGDLLICRLAEPAGRACVFPEIGEEKVVTSVDVTIFRPEAEKVDRRYLVQYLSTPAWFDAVIEQVGGTTHKRIARSALGNISIPLPVEISEQNLIATALSDVDALIAGLEKLIVKKRDLKQAAMQQLLTGQTRLPGFSGEWAVERLGDHFSILKNGVNSRAELSAEGGVAYLHYGDIHGSKSLFLNPRSAAMPTLPFEKAKELDRLQNGDLVFADASEDLDGVGRSVEVQLAADFELVSGQHTIAIRFDKAVLADGFKAYLQFHPAFTAHLRRLAAGTKVYATNRSHIASAEIKLPSIDEQIEIASILQDMDSELAVLEIRLAKTRELKQGMMQELLTGKTRLV